MRKSILLIAWAGLQAAAQTIPYQSNYQFGGMPDPNTLEGPFSLELKPSVGAPSGKVWLRETDDGIVIFTRINSRQLHYARFPKELHSREHVGIWLAAAPAVSMPAVGWANQFGPVTCAEHKPTGNFVKPEDCRLWAARQLQYREQLRRLFMRHWELSPNTSVETYASPAYQDLLGYASDLERQRFVKLEPHGAPLMVTADFTDFSCFLVFVRWSDFPPLDSLNLSRIYITVEFCGISGACSSTAPASSEGDPATFNKLDLVRPKISAITPCEYPLQETDLFANVYPAWYFLNSAGRPIEALSLQNDPVGYRYDPKGLSPIPVWTNYFFKAISKSEFVCGPKLRYKAVTKIFTPAEPKKLSNLDQKHISIRNIPGGHLLQSGPTTRMLSTLGTGQCASCPVAILSIYGLSPQTGITVAFNEALVVNGSENHCCPKQDRVALMSGETKGP